MYSALKHLLIGSRYLIISWILLVSIPTPCFSKQLAMVVGINNYLFADDVNLGNLKGAVNDALSISRALKKLNIQLPEDRILIDNQATRGEVLSAWYRMLSDAQPGDTLIFTYAGHGGQEIEYGEPFDEKDSLDETIMLADFNPYEPEIGRITDDEIYNLFREAEEYNIVFVVDACHSRGLTRQWATTPLGLSRSGGGRWKIDSATKPSTLTGFDTGDESNILPHVTHIMASSSENLEVREISVNGQPRGALSWFFSKALMGMADGNSDNKLSRYELKNFLVHEVSGQTNNTQIPRLWPRGDFANILIIKQDTTSSFSEVVQPTKITINSPNSKTVRISVKGGQSPVGLKNFKYSEQNYDLLFSIQESKTYVYNQTGDLLIEGLPTKDFHAWQNVIDRTIFVQALSNSFDDELPIITITLLEGDNLHNQGARLNFSINVQNHFVKLKALTLFNVSANGSVQLLYPRLDRGDYLLVNTFPYRLPEFQVEPPLGGEVLVSVLCDSPPNHLRMLLTKKHKQQAPSQVEFWSTLEEHRCQMSQYAYFTSQN